MTRRRGLVCISHDAIHALITGGWRMTAGVPADAAVLGISYSFDRQAVVVAVEHHSFGEVADGELTPVVAWLSGEQVSDETTPTVIEAR
jgi:hypothetical protein